MSTNIYEKLYLPGAYHRAPGNMIITQFGEPVGEPINKPGLKIKLPVIQTVRPLDKRILEWDGSPLPPRMTRSLILGHRQAYSTELTYYLNPS